MSSKAADHSTISRPFDKLHDRVDLRPHRTGRELTIFDMLLHLSERDLAKHFFVFLAPVDRCAAAHLSR